MTQLALIFVANFLFIGLKAFQQLNVVHGERGLVLITSNLLAWVEVFLVSAYAQKGPTLPLILTVGMSGGLGCLFFMWFRRRLLREERRATDGP